MRSIMGGLSDIDVASIRATTRAVATEATTATSATLRQQSGVGAYAPSSGLTVYPETATAISGWKATVTKKQLDAVEGLEPGDIIFTVDPSTITATPRPGDRLSVSSDTWRIAKVDTDPLGALHQLYCRRA